MMHITLQQLRQGSTKSSLTRYWQGYKELNGKEPDHGRRHPDTVRSGVLSAKEVDEFYAKRNKERAEMSPAQIDSLGKDSFDSQMLSLELVVASNATHFFITDDYLFGHPFLKQYGFGTCSFGSGLPYRVRPREEFPDGVLRTVADFVKVFYDDLQIIESDEDLLLYLNNHYGNHIPSGTSNTLQP